jgi:hypothetical protein
MPTTPRPTADLSAIEGRLDTVEGDVASATSAAAAAESAASTAAADAATAQSAADAAASAAAAAQTAADDAQADADAAATAASAAQADADAAQADLLLNPAKGLVYRVFGSNKSVTSPSGIEEAGIEVGQIILLAGQSTASQNGAYTFNGNGVAMTRAPNANSAARLNGAFWMDTDGKTWRQSSPVVTLGTDDITISLDTDEYVEYTSTPVTATGAVTSITGLPAVIKPDSVPVLWRNGVRLIEGAGNDYTVSGTTITVASGVLIADDVYYYTCSIPNS